MLRALKSFGFYVFFLLSGDQTNMVVTDFEKFYFQHGSQIHPGGQTCKSRFKRREENHQLAMSFPSLLSHFSNEKTKAPLSHPDTPFHSGNRQLI